MTTRITIATAAIAFLGLVGAAGADELKPIQARSVSLGDLSGVAYFTPGATGYRVVVTLARGEATQPVRFETVLADGQSVILSAPREAGSAAQTVEISREGDTVLVARAQGRTEDRTTTREAAALD